MFQLDRKDNWRAVTPLVARNCGDAGLHKGLEVRRKKIAARCWQPRVGRLLQESLSWWRCIWGCFCRHIWGWHICICCFCWYLGRVWMVAWARQLWPCSNLDPREMKRRGAEELDLLPGQGSYARVSRLQANKPLVSVWDLRVVRVWDLRVICHYLYLWLWYVNL